jgi:hypothetical protein
MQRKQRRDMAIETKERHRKGDERHEQGGRGEASQR